MLNDRFGLRSTRFVGRATESPKYPAIPSELYREMPLTTTMVLAVSLSLTLTDCFSS